MTSTSTSAAAPAAAPTIVSSVDERTPSALSGAAGDGPARPHFVTADPSNGAEGLAGKQRPPCQDGRNALALAVLR